MRIFITGGCKNGKSSFAERSAKKMRSDEPLYYIATMEPHDKEDYKRIIRHKKQREGFDFTTIEISRNIRTVLDVCDTNTGTFLLDSVTALFANEMFYDGKIFYDAYKKVEEDLLFILNKIENIVFVSDYIFSDSFIYNKPTEMYRMGLGHIHIALAKYCDCVIEASFGNFLIIKGEEHYSKLNQDSGGLV